MSCDYRALATPGVQKLSPYVPGKPVEELERELGISDIVKLASNENPLGPSQSALAAIQQQLSELSRYPDGNGFKLKSALAGYLSKASFVSLTPENITLGNGSNDVLELIVRGYVQPGDEVVFSQYAFAVYPLATMSVGATPVQVPASDWGHDLAAMAAAVTDKTRVIFVANPNNPTGTWNNRERVEAFLNAVPEDVIVVLDEAYTEYCQMDDFPDGVSLLDQFPNLIVTRTFSKAWGLASLRVGYAVSSSVIADILNRVRQPFNVDTLALSAATAVLEDTDYLEQSRRVNAEGLAQVSEGLQQLGLEFIPSVGNFITFDTGCDGGEVFNRLLEKGVIVRPVANYGMPAHLRVSIGLPEENKRFLVALREVLGQ